MMNFASVCSGEISCEPVKVNPSLPFAQIQSNVHHPIYVSDKKLFVVAQIINICWSSECS